MIQIPQHMTFRKRGVDNKREIPNRRTQPNFLPNVPAGTNRVVYGQHKYSERNHVNGTGFLATRQGYEHCWLGFSGLGREEQAGSIAQA